MRCGHPWQSNARGVTLRIRLTPKAPRDEIAGLDQFDGAAVLKARVKALPEDGEANRAVALLVAKWLGVQKSAVTVAAGHKSRLKTLSIDGDPALLERQLSDKCAGFV
jgi:uncharacterized protein